MDAVPAWNGKRDLSDDPAEQDLMHEEAWLLGQPPLSRYLDFVSDLDSDSQRSRSAIVDEWRRANDYYAELEASEAGIADDAEIRDLEDALANMAQAVTADARWSRGFDTLPARIGMIELDRLVVSQPYVNLHHTGKLKGRLGKTPTPADLFRFCLPLDRDEAPVQARRFGGNRFLFWSPSSDFRFHEPTLLQPGQITGHDPHGPLAGIVGLLVGYSSNFLSAIQCEGRLLLHNGYHRAYALRELGIKYAPCAVQTASRRDELALVASRTVMEDAAFYFKAARPPLLKDFFDPQIRKVLRVPRMLRMIEVNFEVKEFDTTHFART